MTARTGEGRGWTGRMEVMWASGLAGRHHWQALLMGMTMRERRRNEFGSSTWAGR